MLLNVGIGTTGPTNKLDVAGAISISGTKVLYREGDGTIHLDAAGAITIANDASADLSRENGDGSIFRREFRG